MNCQKRTKHLFERVSKGSRLCIVDLSVCVHQKKCTLGEKKQIYLAHCSIDITVMFFPIIGNALYLLWFT